MYFAPMLAILFIGCLWLEVRQLAVSEDPVNYNDHCELRTYAGSLVLGVL